MRPGLRLAISNLSERRSRTALLIATVALSAALIAAVSCAMESIQRSVRKQAQATVGTSDVRIKHSGTGKTLRNSLLDEVRAWPEVAEASGVLDLPMTLAGRFQFLEKNDFGYTRRDRRQSVNCIATGFDPATTPPFELAEGRFPTLPNEVVIGSLVAVRMSHAGANAKSPFELPSRDRGVRRHLTGPHPEIPIHLDESESAERLALELNSRSGVRIGDEIDALRQILPQINIAAVVSDPKKAAEIAKAAGVGIQLDGLAGLFRKPQKLKVVGIAAVPPFGGRPKCYMTLEGLNSLLDVDSQLSEIGIVLRSGVDPDSFVQSRGPTLDDDLVMQTTAKATSGLERNMEASRLGLVLATIMAFLAASFIIMTGMTTSVTERQRELGILRCIGATRLQLVQAQLATGAIVGAMGAIVGIPLGIAVAATIVRILQRQIEITYTNNPWGFFLAAVGAVIAGLAGAAYPAWMSARVSPLAALASRAGKPSRRGVFSLLAIGLACCTMQISIVTLTTDGQWRFWLYATLGLPALFVGYFALSVPVMVVITRCLAAPVSALLRLPPNIVKRTVLATPYRHGFTAGAMMGGLALMVGIWTQGGSIQRDWLGKIDFPDAFVAGLNLDSGAQATIDSLPFVERTCAITLHPIDTDVFGVRALQKYKSTFMAFEPEPFFAMTRPIWVQGDLESAMRKLAAGGAVIVAKEFHIARGLGVGDTFTCRSNDREFNFEIAGVVTSPGLEVISQFFNIGEDFTSQSLHAVFGTRQDLRDKFGSDAIHLIQIAFKPGVDDEQAVQTIQASLAGAGILDAGSGRKVKEQIQQLVEGGLLAASAVAIMAMLVAGFGVANLIIAGIGARQFEFGVLRAVGGSRGLVVRLVLAEAVLIALTAAFAGTLMGLQGVFAVQRIDELLFGLTLHLRPPPLPIAVGWGAVMVMTLGAAAPAVISLGRKRVRELLATVRG